MITREIYAVTTVEGDAESMALRNPLMCHYDHNEAMKQLKRLHDRGGRNMSLFTIEVIAKVKRVEHE